VPVERRQLGWTPISVIGPMGRTVADTCLQFGASVGQHACDPLTYAVDGRAFTQLAPADLASLRVGYTEDFGVCPVDDGIRTLFRQRIAAIRHLFRSVDEVRPDMGEADRCFDVVRAASFVAAFRQAYEADPGSLGPNVRANYEMGANMTMADATWAHLEQTRIFRSFQALYEDFDLILSPTTPVSPFAWTLPYLDQINGQKLRNYYHWLGLTYVVTLATNPALALPCGVDAGGMPFGLQLIGRFRGDAELLSVAQAMEAAFTRMPETQRPQPDLARLARPVPELKSIVTHPPIFDAAVPSAATGGQAAV
jgi:amidase